MWSWVSCPRTLLTGGGESWLAENYPVLNRPIKSRVSPVTPGVHKRSCCFYFEVIMTECCVEFPGLAFTREFVCESFWWKVRQQEDKKKEEPSGSEMITAVLRRAEDQTTSRCNQADAIWNIVIKKFWTHLKVVLISCLIWEMDRVFGKRSEVTRKQLLRKKHDQKKLKQRKNLCAFWIEKNLWKTFFPCSFYPLSCMVW